MPPLPEPVHLYVKTHRVTGLKYFGKTTANPHQYMGSGAYWTRHLQKYGNRVDTVVVGTYHKKCKLRSAALAFSDEHNIADSTEWANLLPEDGGNPGAGWTGSSDHSKQIAALDAAVERRLPRSQKAHPGSANEADDDGPDKTFWVSLVLTALALGLYMQAGSEPGDGYADGQEYMHFLLGVGLAVCTPIGWLVAGIASWLIEKLTDLAS